MAKGFRSGTSTTNGLGLKMFQEDDLWNLHYATLDVLSKIGVKVESEKAREIYAGIGCSVDSQTHIVKIPPYLVEDAMTTAPSSFRACGRNPKNDWYCEGSRTGFVNFGESVNIIDPYTRKRRKPNKKDIWDSARMVNAMENIAVFERCMVPEDVNPHVGQVWVAEGFYNNCTKHALIGMNRPENIRAACKMGAIVSGGEDKFRERPLFTTSCDPISPLVHSKGAVDSLIQAIECGISSKINPMGLPGGTTCVHLAGTLVTHNAEVTSMFVLGQAVKKGVPLIYGTSTAMMDLRSTLSAVGTPELALFSAAVANVAQFYKVPSFVAGG